jgi:hypothetical protein
MAFLSWLISMGNPLGKIAPTMVELGNSGTLAQLYSRLTVKAPSEAWPAFQSAIVALPGGVTSDDPFGGSSAGAHLSYLAPESISLAGEVFASILADLSANKSPEKSFERRRLSLGLLQRRIPAIAAAAIKGGGGDWTVVFSSAA